MSEIVSIDLSNYRDRVGQRVAPGRYLVSVGDAERDTSRAGNPMVILNLTIEGPSHEGATLVDRLTVTDKALFRVVEFMQALGMPTPRKRLNLNLRSLIGRRLVVDVVDGEPYNGRVRSEIAGYLRATPENLPGGMSSAPASDSVDLADLEDAASSDAGAEDVDVDADEPVDLNALSMGAEEDSETINL